MLHQDALPPYTFTCRCGASWLPGNARGKQHPTAASLQREAEEHFKQCPGHVVDMAAAPSGSEPGAAGSD